MRASADQKRGARLGYSLVELLLTVALLLLFSGVAVVSIQSMSNGSALTEGTVRFETLLRFARAEAAYLGRCVRVEFVQEHKPEISLAEEALGLSSVQLSWEPDPISEPGVFRELMATRWGLEGVNEAVGVKAVRLTDPAMVMPPDTAGLSEATAEPGFAEVPTPVPALTFNPDGSCDSAEITLASRSPEDERLVIVRLEGFTGLVSHREPAVLNTASDSLSTETDVPAMGEPGDNAAQ